MLAAATAMIAGVAVFVPTSANASILSNIRLYVENDKDYRFETTVLTKSAQTLFDPLESDGNARPEPLTDEKCTKEFSLTVQPGEHKYACFREIYGVQSGGLAWWNYGVFRMMDGVAVTDSKTYSMFTDGPTWEIPGGESTKIYGSSEFFHARVEIPKVEGKNFTVTLTWEPPTGQEAQLQMLRAVNAEYRATGAVPDTVGGYNVIVGTDSDDTIIGTPGPDLILGLGGDDFIKGLGGDDLIAGGSGADSIHGGKGDDVVSAGSGRDIAYGGSGTDLLTGDKGRDIVVADRDSGTTRDRNRDIAVHDTSGNHVERRGVRGTLPRFNDLTGMR